MKKNIFSLRLLRHEKFDLPFFRAHVSFISSLFAYVSEQKMFFLRHPLFLRDYIKKEFLLYMKTDRSSFLNYLFSHVIAAMEEVYANFSRDLFFYIHTFLLDFMDKAHYGVAFLYCSSLESITKKQIEEVYLFFNQQYQIHAKICLVLLNKHIEKGFLIKYKNTVVDISIKKLIYQLQNIIDVKKIGELVDAKYA
jgi:hypothetical protein